MKQVVIRNGVLRAGGLSNLGEIFSACYGVFLQVLQRDMGWKIANKLCIASYFLWEIDARNSRFQSEIGNLKKGNVVNWWNLCFTTFLQNLYKAIIGSSRVSKVFSIHFLVMSISCKNSDHASKILHFVTHAKHNFIRDNFRTK